MKRILVLLLVCCFISCSDDDTVGGFDVELNGSWTLTNVSCFCGFPEDVDFSSTQVTFVERTNELLVAVDDEGAPYFKPQDLYAYSGSGNTINFDDGSSFTFEIDEDILQLIFIDNPNIADDEISFTFEKNPDV